MTRVKMVLVVDHGVLGYIIREKEDGCAVVCWYLDGLRYESNLEEDIEYVVKFAGEVFE